MEERGQRGKELIYQTYQSLITRRTKGQPCNVSQGRRHGFDPWSGNWIPHISTKSSHAVTKTQHSQINKINAFKKITPEELRF